MDLSIVAMVLLGIGASLKDVYQVLVRESVKNIGSLLATSFITASYMWSIYRFDTPTNPVIRLGLAMLFLDKIIVALYDLTNCKRKNSTKTLDVKTIRRM